MINQFSFQDVNYLLYSIVLIKIRNLHTLEILNLNKDSVVDSYKFYIAITIIKTSTNNCIRGKIYYASKSTRTLHIGVK